MKRLFIHSQARWSSVRSDALHGVLTSLGQVLRPASLVTLTSLALCSCTTPLADIRSPKPGGADAEGWNLIHKQASQDLNCPLSSLSTKILTTSQNGDISKYSFEISGCERAEITWLSSSNSRWLQYFSDIDLRKKLKFSYADKCATWSIEFVDDNTRGVSGCGQKVIYVFTSSGWVANTMTDKNGKMQ